MTGGSQGALHLDRTIAGAIPSLAGRADLQLLVLTGAGKESVVADAADAEMDLVVRTFPILDRMELALAVADVAVARAGANTIHELAACGIPSILVPYPHATDDHQLANATELRGAGAAQIVLDRELDPARSRATGSRRSSTIRIVRASMGAAAAAWATPDADERVAALVAIGGAIDERASVPATAPVRSRRSAFRRSRACGPCT